MKYFIDKPKFGGTLWFTGPEKPQGKINEGYKEVTEEEFYRLKAENAKRTKTVKTALKTIQC